MFKLINVLRFQTPKKFIDLYSRTSDDMKSQSDNDALPQAKYTRLKIMNSCCLWLFSKIFQFLLTQ